MAAMKSVKLLFVFLFILMLFLNNYKVTSAYVNEGVGLTVFPTNEISLAETKISLKDNSLSELLPEQVDGFWRLNELLLGSNAFTDVPYLHADTKNTLEILDLSKNPLGGMNTSRFLGFMKLEDLDLQSCNLTYFPDLGEDIKSTLMHLDLSGNQLKTILPDIMANFAALQYISLSNNQLVEFPGFSDAKSSLQEVNLRDNNIKEISTSDFLGFLQLQHLLLSNNELTHMPDIGTAVKATLISAALENNLIKSISADAFLELNTGMTLNLSNNQLDTVPSFCSQNVPNVYFSPGNNILCDCRLRDAWHHSQIASSIQCTAPASLSGVDLADALLAELQCEGKNQQARSISYSFFPQ